MTSSKVPENVLNLIQDFITFRGDDHNRQSEVNVLRGLVFVTTKALSEGGSTDTAVAIENLRWFKLRLDELGAGEVRA